MDVVASHSCAPGGGATENSDQSECISSQPATRRPNLLQSEDQHACPEAHREADAQTNTPNCDVISAISDVTSGIDTLSRDPPPPSAATNLKRLSSNKSHTSCKTNSALIEEAAGDDCCVHCLLACLFCELPSMCWAAERCVTCGGSMSNCCWLVDTCCCCCCCCCCEEACEASLDCGILEECSSSADCLEICLECCAICFPS
ncbi:myoD family inhibitor [Vanacampus margaritifer]